MGRFQIGDIVGLITEEGPKMIVEGYERLKKGFNYDSVICRWFDKNTEKFTLKTFPDAVLKAHPSMPFAIQSMPKYKLGDIVIFKLDEPGIKMVIEAIDNKTSKQDEKGNIVLVDRTDGLFDVECIWWNSNSNQFQSAVFPVQQIKLLKP